MSDRFNQPLGESKPSPVLKGAVAAEVRAADDFDAEFPDPKLLSHVQDMQMSGRVAALPIMGASHPDKPQARSDQLLIRASELFAEAQARQTEAQEMLEQASQRAAKIEREAYEKGYHQGEAAGLEMGQAKMEPMLQDFNKLIERIAAVHDEVIRANQNQLLDLAVAVATRILHRELETGPDQIMHTLDEVLSHIGREQRVRLRVSQVDFQHLIDNQDQIPALDRLGDNVTFEVDPKMMKGGCHAQTDTGAINATIEAMYHEMRSALRSQRNFAEDVPLNSQGEDPSGEPAN